MLGTERRAMSGSENLLLLQMILAGPGSFPTSTWENDKPVTAGPDDLLPSSGLRGYCMHFVHIHTEGQNIHMH